MFYLEFSPIWGIKKRSNKESLIYLMRKPNHKNFRSNWSLIMVFIKPIPYAPRLRYVGRFRKQKIELPIRIVVRLRLLLRRDLMKYQKKLFWRHANCLEFFIKKWLSYWANLFFITMYVCMYVSTIPSKCPEVYVYVIIIMSRRLRGYPWPSLAISPYHSSPPAGLQDYNPCPHIAAVC